jgi:hypothetical protein
LKKKNKNRTRADFLFLPRSGPAGRPARPRLRPHPRSAQPRGPAAACLRPRASASPSLSDSAVPPVIPHLCLPLALPRAHSLSHGGRPVTGASVDKPTLPTPSTPPHDSVLLLNTLARALATSERRRWRHGGHGSSTPAPTKR